MIVAILGIVFFSTAIFIGVRSCSKPNPVIVQKEEVIEKVKPIDSTGIIENEVNTAFPKQVGYVNDYENLFTENEQKILENKISTFEKQANVEIALININSIEPFTNLKEYSTALSNEWGIGKNATNNGITIINCTALKQIRISISREMEKILTDEICNNILQQTIFPEIRNGSYYKGIDKGLTALMENILKQNTLKEIKPQNDISSNKIFDKKMKYKDGLAAVKIGNKWGFVNKNDEVVIPAIYDDVSSFSAGYAIYLKNNRFGFISTSNKEGDLGDVGPDENSKWWYECTNNGEWYEATAGKPIPK